MVNPKMDFGCAAYCKFAEQCLGDLPPELIAQKKDLLKDRVAIEMKHFFKQDFTNIKFGDVGEGHESRTRKESLLRGLRGCWKRRTGRP
jgi:hypothetical protein